MMTCLTWRCTVAIDPSVTSLTINTLNVLRAGSAKTVQYSGITNVGCVLSCVTCIALIRRIVWYPTTLALLTYTRVGAVNVAEFALGAGLTSGVILRDNQQAPKEGPKTLTGSVPLPQNWQVWLLGGVYCPVPQR